MSTYPRVKFYQETQTVLKTRGATVPDFLVPDSANA